MTISSPLLLLVEDEAPLRRFLRAALAGEGYLRVFMASLRRKIEADPAQPKYLLTEQGVGYRFAGETGA